MESHQPILEPVVETPATKNQTLWIIAIVVIILCCCCIVLAVAGIGLFGIRSSQSQFQPVEDVAPIVTEESVLPTLTSDTVIMSGAPTGGLGNDVLRNDAWQYVAAAAQGQGCEQPIGADTTIDVLQEPQDGVWVEQWNVACASGSSYSYEVQFTLDDTGTTFDIKPLP